MADGDASSLLLFRWLLKSFVFLGLNWFLFVNIHLGGCPHSWMGGIASHYSDGFDFGMVSLTRCIKHLIRSSGKVLGLASSFSQVY